MRRMEAAARHTAPARGSNGMYHGLVCYGYVYNVYHSLPPITANFFDLEYFPQLKVARPQGTPSKH